MTTEYIYLGHDNTVDRILKADGVAIETADITRITATFNDGTYINSISKTGDIKWDQVGYDAGEIRFDLGGSNIKPGEHDGVPIVVYDAVYTDGILWDYIDFIVVKDPEGS